MKFIVSSFLLFFLSFPLFAQKLEMSNVPITEFTNWYSQMTGKGIILPPDFKELITIYNTNINGDNIDMFFASVMASRGYEVLTGNPIIIQKSRSIDINKIINPENDISNDDANGSSLEYLMDYPIQSQPKLLETSTKTYKLNNITASSAFPAVDIYLKSFPTSGSAVIIDKASNSLVISTNKGNFDNLNTFIQDIDVRTHQVLIEAIIFEIGKGESFDFSFGAGKRSNSQIIGGINTNSLGESLSSLGGSFGIYSGNILSLAVTAVEGSKDSKILSVPRILTLSGSEGFISSGQNVPIVTGKVVGEGVDVKNPFQTITRKDVGINLRVTPIVLGDKSIMLDIESNSGSISNITDASDIILNERSINTTVQLNNGDTLLIGGLIQHSAINDKSSTPIASSIPVIGWLFDSKSESESENTMYILIRARIVTPI
ncbi:general secretion pathway protein GspD [Proteus terrae]|uniref:general secretion pathway protein GspD n=1 Tax=Proteus terrae TaxID=1574161 RepID=UPI001F4217F9|nr:general secretion pathway protein GspD [Proteus terrae]